MVDSATHEGVVHEALLRCEPETAQEREEAALAARGVEFVDGRSTATCATAIMTATLDMMDAVDLDSTITDIATAMGRLGDDSASGSDVPTRWACSPTPNTLDVFGGLRPDTLPDTDTAGVNAAGVQRRATTIRSTVYLHVDIDDLRAAAHPDSTSDGRTGGRIENLGPATLHLLHDWLTRSASGTIRPVLDTSRTDRIDGHDPTEAMRETVILPDGHCVFPGCRTDARSCDLDHTSRSVPPRHGGSPGQTSAAALACLCRQAPPTQDPHRLALPTTHRRLRVDQSQRRGLHRPPRPQALAGGRPTATPPPTDHHHTPAPTR